jgi:hypothetical protein
LVLGVVALIGAVAFGFYFYERAGVLRLAEERAKAVGERVYEAGPQEGAEAGNLKPE